MTGQLLVTRQMPDHNQKPLLADLCPCPFGSVATTRERRATRVLTEWEPQGVWRGSFSAAGEVEIWPLWVVLCTGQEDRKGPGSLPSAWTDIFIEGRGLVFLYRDSIDGVRLSKKMRAMGIPMSPRAGFDRGYCRSTSVIVVQCKKDHLLFPNLPLMLKLRW